MSDIVAWAKEVASTAGAKTRPLPFFREALQSLLSKSEAPALHSGEFVKLLADSLYREFGTSANPRKDDAELLDDEFNVIDEEDLANSRMRLMDALKLHDALRKEHLAGNSPDELSIRRIVRAEMSKRNVRAREFMAEAAMAPRSKKQLTDRQRQILGPHLATLRSNAEKMRVFAEPIDLVGVAAPEGREVSGAVFTRGRMLRMIEGMPPDMKHALHCLRSVDYLGYSGTSLDDMMVVILTDETIESSNGVSFSRLPVVTSIKVRKATR